MKRHIDKIKGAHYERGYVYDFHYHLAWVTKYRHNLFTTPELVNEMTNLLIDIAKNNEITIDDLTIKSNYIHLIISFKPKLSATTVVKALKGNSAKRFFEQHPTIKNDQFWDGHLWSKSYFMSTVGNMNNQKIMQYIQNQYQK